MDLEKFFDRVNHDILMSRIARKIKDKRVLLLIRKYLQSDIMIEEIKITREEGTPQGGPLSPLLSNILLDDLDKELERRGHKFCRYADDCNIYVQSEEAGKRVMESIKKYLEKKLKLKVNEQKSQVARPWKRKFLGYTVTRGNPRIKIADKSIDKLKDKVRDKLCKGKGRSLKSTIEELNPLLKGWINYFKLIEVKKSSGRTGSMDQKKIQTNRMETSEETTSQIKSLYQTWGRPWGSCRNSVQSEGIMEKL